MQKPLRFFLSIAYFTLLLVCAVTSFYFWLYPAGSNAGWYVTGTFDEFRVREVDPKGPATALHPGDVVVAINGKKISEHPDALNNEFRVPPGSTYSMTVRRNGEELTFSWPTLPRPRGSFAWDRLVWLLFLLTGLLVLLLRSDDQQAWLLALMLGSFPTLLSGAFLEEVGNKWLSLVVSLAHACGLLSLPLLLHLFLLFPGTPQWVERRPSLTRWIYLPSILLIIPVFCVNRLPIEWSSAFYTWPVVRWLTAHGLPVAAYLALLGYLVAALICLYLNYRTADTGGRRRMRVLMWGSLTGFGALFLVFLMEATGIRDRMRTVWDWLLLLNLFTLPLIPLSFAYAIVRHRVIPISLIIRRGVRYLLVSRGSILLMLAFTGAVVASLLALLFNYLRPSALMIGLISAAEGIAAWHVARWLHRRYLAPVIDRQFFRQSYDAQQIVSELSESVRTTTDVPSLIEAVANKLQTALQTENVVVFLRDEATGDYHAAYSCEYSGTVSGSVTSSNSSILGHSTATISHIRETGEPLELDDTNPTFDLDASSDQLRMTNDERKTLVDLKTAVLLPLKTKDVMLGVVALGSRLGDVPFSGEDKRLMKSVGNSASLALENAQLVTKMIDEARRRQEVEAENEQRARELEEARQLQISMLPKLVPQVPHFEIAAYMKTATEVGGDYYDFCLEPDGQLTIAIGDATGHGLKAGTVVTATKGLFSHLATQPDLVTTLAQTSRALKQMNLRSLFMALTLVKLNGNQLQCSVAGMPPILIYRAASGTIEEVPLYGVPLGGLSNYDYRQEEVTLAANDVVLLLSDGLPERFNTKGEMFGYERTKDVLLAHASASPQEMLESLIRESDEWAERKPADDDMTFVALRRMATESLADRV